MQYEKKLVGYYWAGPLKKALGISPIICWNRRRIGLFLVSGFWPGHTNTALGRSKPLNYTPSLVPACTSRQEIRYLKSPAFVIWCLTGLVGKPQEEDMMSTPVNLPPVMIPRFNRPVGEINHSRRLLLADFGNDTRVFVDGACLERIFSASSNMEHAYNTTKILCPNLQWGCQSHRFADNKGLNVSCGKW
jgi:hypothetical protein